jgi:hypothetical protein
MSHLIVVYSSIYDVMDGISATQLERLTHGITQMQGADLYTADGTLITHEQVVANGARAKRFAIATATLLETVTTHTVSGAYLGVCWTGTDLLTAQANIGNRKIYLHLGFTGTIQSSFGVSSDRYALAFDGTNLISMDTNTIFVHQGISATITTSFASPETGSLGGLAVDDSGNLISARGTIYHHSGITSTIQASYPLPLGSQVRGLAYTTETIFSSPGGAFFASSQVI